MEIYESISKEERDKIPAADFADPEHRKYYIRNCQDVKDAWDLAGRSKDTPPATIRAAIKRIAKRKGLTSCLPDTATEAKEAARFVTHLPVQIVEASEGKRPVVMLIAAGTSNGVHGALHYPKDALAREAGKFEHIPVFNNHQSPKEEAEKPYRAPSEHLGYIDGVHYDATIREWAPQGGLVGDLDIFPDQAWLETRIRSRPEAVHFSIRASGMTGGTLPGNSNVPILESFVAVKSCDAVIRGGAGGRVISVAEAEDEEVEMLLRDISLDALREHPQWSEIERIVKEAYVSSDYDDKDPDLQKWKTRMAKAKATGDQDAHDKLLESIPSYHRHDMGECPFCNSKVMLPPGTPTTTAVGVVESGKETDMDPKELAKIVREAVKEETASLREQVDVLSRQNRQAITRQSLQRTIAESGLPATAQSVLLEDLLEASAEGMLPEDEAKRTAAINRRVARFKTLAFAPGSGAKAKGQGGTEAEIAEGEGDDGGIEEMLSRKLRNPNKPMESPSAGDEAARFASRQTQVTMGGQRPVMEAARPRNALEAAWADETTVNVGVADS